MSKLSTDLACIKYITLLVNFLFLLTGLILIGLGAYALAEGVQELTPVAIPVGIIAIGCLIFITSFFGCCGAAKESRCMLMTYSIFVLLFILIEVVLGVVAYVKRDSIPEIANNSWTQLYDHDRSSIEVIENTFKCCGWYDVSDRAVPPLYDTDPETCVAKYPDFASSPCQPTIEQAIDDSLVIAGIAAISVAAFQLFCLIFSCCLFSRLPNQKQKEEALLEEARRLNREGHNSTYQSNQHRSYA